MCVLKSDWKNWGQTDHEKGWVTLNYRAIGIEIDSSGFVDPLNKEDRPGTYTKAQIKSVRFLVHHLQKRFHITNQDVLGHSDISPYRIENGQVVLGKNDPSESFPWSKVLPAPLKMLPLTKEEQSNILPFLEKALTTIGYDMNRDHAVPFEQKHLALKYCLLAFCRHYTPQYVAQIKIWNGLDMKVLPQKLLGFLKGMSR